MANFSPQWDLVLDNSIITEGQSTYARLRLSKQNSNDLNSDYFLSESQYLQINYSIILNGTTVKERDYIVSVGENISSLVLIKDASTGNNKLIGKHVTNLDNKSFTLQTDYLDTYFIKIECPVDGVWDDTQTLVIKLNSVLLYDTEDGQIVSISNSGVIETDTITLIYDKSNDFWVTPDLVTHQKNLFTIGEITYGAESRLFVQAFGYSRAYDPVLDGNSTDTSNRVFVPSYKLVDIDITDIPNENITSQGTVLIPKSTSPNTEETEVLIKDELGNIVDTGLKFNSNGQFLQTFLYDSEPIDGYCKVQIVSITDFYNTTNTSFYEGKRFKAYQTWVAPSDVTGFTPTAAPIPNHLYQLKDNKIYPYVVKSEVIQGETLLVFEEDKWNDLGYYSEDLGSNLIGKQKIFRLVLNNSDDTEINFETAPNLGFIHVGEYFGHSTYPKIVASGSDLITYTLSPNSVNDITKYNINLSADGYLTGTAYCETSDFDTNDEVPLKFTVYATSKKGTVISQDFYLTIIPGFGPNFMSTYLKMSTAFERAYFKCISSEQFNNYKFYRESDKRFGRQTVPNILLKENFVNPIKDWTDIKDIKKKLREGIINTSTGSVIPDSTFQYVIGNYKVLTAIDNNGNELYDVLYREMLPFGSNPKPETDPRKYNINDYFSFTEVYGIRQNIFSILGEDVRNLNRDPDDFENRAVTVPELDSVSEAMVDTVPRFMAHAMTDTGIKNGYRPMMVVAYLNPGEGDLLFNNLVTASEHTNMLGEIVEVQFVNFTYFSNEGNKYVEQSFAIQIPSKSLMA